MGTETGTSRGLENAKSNSPEVIRTPDLRFRNKALGTAHLQIPRDFREFLRFAGQLSPSLWGQFPWFPVRKGDNLRDNFRLFNEGGNVNVKHLDGAPSCQSSAFQLACVDPLTSGLVVDAEKCRGFGKRKQSRLSCLAQKRPFERVR